MSSSLRGGFSDFDSLGNLYVANFGSSNVSKITSVGSSSYISAGNSPIYLVVDSNDNVFVTNRGDNSISKITPLGVSTTFVTLTGTVNNNVFDITIDSSDNLYVSMSLNNEIQKITPLGVVTIFNNSSIGSSPGRIRFDSLGNLFVLCNTSEIYKITPSGVTTLFYSLGGLYDFIIDTLDNLFLVTNSNVIYKITSSGVLNIFTTGAQSGTNRICVDLSNNLYVSNSTSTPLLYKINTSAVITPLSSAGDFPAYMIFNNGFVYVSNFSGVVTRVTT